MHSSMQTWHIAMQASSIDIRLAGVMPCIRSMVRIMVLHMSAQFMHAGAQSIICVAQIVHACSHAEQASIQACIIDMSIESMPGIAIMSFDIMPIIVASIPCSRPSQAVSGQRPAPLAMLGPPGGVQKASGTLSW